MLYDLDFSIQLKFPNNISRSLRRKIRPSVLYKYNTSSKIISEITHPESREIIFAIIKKSKTIEEIYRETGFPMSSIYKQVKDLLEVGLIYVEKRDFSPNERIVKHYRSKIREAKIEFTRREPKIHLVENVIKPKKPYDSYNVYI